MVQRNIKCRAMGQRTPDQVHIRLTPELANWLDEEARRRMVSRRFIVERALEELRERESVAS